MSDKPLAEGPEDTAQTEVVIECPHCQIAQIVSDCIEQEGHMFASEMLSRVTGEFFSGAKPAILRLAFAEFIASCLAEAAKHADEPQMMAMVEAVQSIQITITKPNGKMH